jgi:hypothetical protein
MAALRLALILFLSLGLDPASLSPVESVEVFEEFEETLHRSQSRRPVRPLQEIGHPSVAHQAQAAFVLPPRPATPLTHRPPAGGLMRKVPPPVSDPASASEDH